MKIREIGKGFNKITIIGVLGRDPEMRYTPDGKPVCTFPMSFNQLGFAENWKKPTDLEWINIITSGALAEQCKETLCYGQYAYVEGQLASRNWNDENGNKHKTIEIIANEMVILNNLSPLSSE